MMIACAFKRETFLAVCAPMFRFCLMPSQLELICGYMLITNSFHVLLKCPFSFVALLTVRALEVLGLCRSMLLVNVLGYSAGRA